jgi:uncharacterized protein (TIGR01244 family)
MNVPVQSMSQDLSVAPQLGPEAMQVLADAGFKSVINNRPDFEGGPQQPTSAVIEQAAMAAGLSYAHLPVAPGHQSPEEISRFAELVATLPKPIVAFCRSGTRSGKLYRAATGG